MRYAVLIKQVPADLSVSMQSDYTIDRRHMTAITNPADQSALALALDCRARTGGEVLCVTMGPEGAVSCLEEAAMQGADALYHIRDARLAGADSLVTAEVLAAALRKLGDIDLVFCGRHTVDGETGQVGPEIAEMLGFACISHVLSVSDIRPSDALCACMMDGGVAQYAVSRPAVLCICECKAIQPMPTLAAMRRAAKVPVATWTLDALDLATLSGKRNSPTRVLAVHPNAHKRRHTIWMDSTRVAADLDDTLRSLKEKRE